ILSHPHASRSLIGATEAALGDLALERGDRAEARRWYREAQREPSDDAGQRLITVKLLATEEAPGPVADELERLVGAGPHDAAADLLTTHRLVVAAPDRGLTRYLYARQLQQHDRFEEARLELERALEL